MRRKQRGVGETEQGAVRLTHVGQAGITQGLSEPVQVHRDVDGTDVREDLGTRALAGGCVLPQLRDQLGLLGRRDRDRVRGVRRWASGGLTARERIAAAHAPGVEHHDVEVVEDPWREHPQLVRHVVHAREAGATRIDHQRSDPRRRNLRRMPGQGDRDGRPVRVGRVEWNREVGALQVDATE